MKKDCAKLSIDLKGLEGKTDIQGEGTALMNAWLGLSLMLAAEAHIDKDEMADVLKSLPNPLMKITNATRKRKIIDFRAFANR